MLSDACAKEHNIVTAWHAGDALFQTHENLEHLAMMEATLGPLPERLVRQAARHAAKYFTSRFAALLSHSWLRALFAD